VRKPSIPVLNLWLSTLVGLVITAGMFNYYRSHLHFSKSYGPVKSIAKASETGHATNIIRGDWIGNAIYRLPSFVNCFLEQL